MPPLLVPLGYVRGGRLVTPDPEGGWRKDGTPESDTDRVAELFRKHEHVYLVDLDGQKSGVANLEFYQRLERRQVSPWVDGGCRKPEDAMDLLFAGAEALTIQPRHMPPKAVAEVRDLAEADLHLGYTIEARGLEQRLAPRDALDLARRLDAKGVVLYEADGADYHAAENIAYEITRSGVPVAWVARPGSPHTRRAAASERFARLVAAEEAP